MAGAGVDAHIVYHLDPILKAKLGKLAYWAGGGKQFLRRLEEFEVEVNGKKHHCSFALISKVRNYGGDFEIASEVRLEDEEFEVVLFEGPNPWRYVIYMAGVAVKQAARLPGVTVVSKFKDRNTALRRIWQAVNRPESAPPSPAIVAHVANARKAAKAKQRSGEQDGTKSERILALLKQPEGATLKAIMAATCGDIPRTSRLFRTAITTISQFATRAPGRA